MKNKIKLSTITFLVLFFSHMTISAQVSVALENIKNPVRSTSMVRKFLTPTRIVWSSDKTGKSIQNPDVLLKPGIGQAILNKDKGFIFKSTKTEFPMIILDFGKEIQGGIEIITSINNTKKWGKYVFALVNLFQKQ